MAKKAADDAKRAKTNGYDADRVKAIVGKIEGYFDDLASEQGTYMQRCRSIRENIAAAYEEAKAFGLPKKELRAVVKARDLEGKAKAIRDAMEEEQAETYDQIRFALGDLADTPLGGAAMNGNEKPKTDVVADNVRKLETGIRPLPN